MKKKNFIRYNLIRLVSALCVAAILSASLAAYLYSGYSEILKTDYLSRSGWVTEHNLSFLAYSHKYADANEKPNKERIGSAVELLYLLTIYKELDLDYIRFARVTENGDLENIYETEYDSIEVTGISMMYPTIFKQTLWLTENPDKAGKRINLFEDDPAEYRLYARCDDVVAKIRENSEKKKLFNSWASWGFDMDAVYGYSDPTNLSGLLDFLDYDSVLYKIWESFCDLLLYLPRKMAVVPTAYKYDVSGILNYKDNTVEDVDVYLSDYDDWQSGVVKNKHFNVDYTIDTLNLPDSVPFNGEAIANIRPDYILEKYRDELFPDQSVLKEMQNREFDSLDIPNLHRSTYLHKLKEIYGPIRLSGISKSISDNGYLVNYGFFKANDELYLYTYVIPYAGFWESFGAFLAVSSAIIFTICILISLLSGIRPYRRYCIIFGRARFKNMLLESLAQNIKAPVDDISHIAVKLGETEDSEETCRLTDRVLSTVSEMNKTVEEVLKGADSNGTKIKFRLNDLIEEAAEEAKISVRIKDGITIKAERNYVLRALSNLFTDASRYADQVDVHIRNFKTVITFDADNYIPGTEVAIADKHLSMTGMQLIVSVDGKKVKEEIRYRSRYEQ